MSLDIFNGLTSQTVDLFILDSSSTTGAGKTGLVFNTAGLAICYRKGATGAATAITLATQTVGGAWSSGGFVEIDATNMPGLYRLDLPNAAVDASGFVTIYVKGTGIAVAPTRVDCRPVNTVTNTTNAPTTGDLTATMKTSVTTAATAATPTVTVGDKTGFSLTQGFPSNFAALGINASGHILRTVLNDTTNTNTDMRGTDGANTATPLDAAGTRNAVGLGAANLDAKFAQIPVIGTTYRHTQDAVNAGAKTADVTITEV